VNEIEQFRLLSDCLGWVDTDRRQDGLAADLASGPYPDFEPGPGRPGFLLRIDADGTRRVGRFLNREFEDEQPKR